MYRLKLSVLLFVSAILIGCIKIPIGDGESIKFSKDGFTITNKEGTDAEMTYDEEGFSISAGEDGDGLNISAGVNTDLPEGFPEEIPLAVDADIIQAADRSEDDGHYFMIMYFSEQPLEKVTTMYKEFIKSAGFEEADAEMEQEVDSEELFTGGEIIQTVRGETEYLMVSILQDEDSDNDVVNVSITYGNE